MKRVGPSIRSPAPTHDRVEVGYNKRIYVIARMDLPFRVALCFPRSETGNKPLDILLVHPPLSGDFFSMPGKEIPLHLCGIASSLHRAGHSAEILDLNLGRVDEPRLRAVLQSRQPRIVGITSYTMNVDRAGDVARWTKAFDPRITTVLGGFHASALPRETLAEFPDLDMIVFGEGENTLVEILENEKAISSGKTVDGLVYRSNGQVITGLAREPIADLDELPFPARGLVPVRRYIPSPGNFKTLPSSLIYYSRGCPFHCSFCSKSVFGQTTRYRSAAHFVDEMEQTGRDDGILDFRLADEIPTVQPQRMRDLCDEIVRRGLAVHWNCNSRVDVVNLDLLRTMKRAGCYHVMYGAESGNPETLRRIGKKTTMDQIRSAIQMTHQVGMECKASFMIGFPWETPEDIDRTIRFSKSLAPDYAYFNVFKPMPGSSLHEEMTREGKIRHRRWSDYYTGNETQFFDTATPQEVLRKKLRQASFSFYFRPSYLLQKVARIAKNPGREIQVVRGGLWFMAVQIANILFSWPKKRILEKNR